MDAEDLIKQASERVRSALEAAQRRADEIVREAEAEAQRIRAKAEAEARERLDQVRQALERLEAGLGREPLRRTRAPSPAGGACGAGRRRSPPEEPRAPERDRARAGGRQPEARARTRRPATTPAAARLVAMKLALDGTSRDEARKQLAADYEVDDLDSLLDDVYAKAGK